MAQKKYKTTNLFNPPLLLLLLDAGSEMDSKSKIRDKQPVFATLVFRQITFSIFSMAGDPLLEQFWCLLTYTKNSCKINLLRNVRGISADLI